MMIGVFVYSLLFFFCHTDLCVLHFSVPGSPCAKAVAICCALVNNDASFLVWWYCIPMHTPRVLVDLCSEHLV